MQDGAEIEHAQQSVEQMSGRVVHHVASEDNPRPTGKERIQRALAVAPNNRRGDVGEHESAHTEKRKELVRCATFTAREACSSRNKATRWRRQREPRAEHTNKVPATV